MATVFKTRADGRDVVINGVGLLPARGRGGITVDEAAAAGLQELQERDDSGQLVLDDEGRTMPLAGKDLTAAARAFAEQVGIEVAVVKEDDLAKLREERGLAPDRPPAGEVSQELYRRFYGDVEHANADPEALAGVPEGEAVAGTPPGEGGEQ